MIHTPTHIRASDVGVKAMNRMFIQSMLAFKPLSDEDHIDLVEYLEAINAHPSMSHNAREACIQQFKDSQLFKDFGNNNPNAVKRIMHFALTCIQDATGRDPDRELPHMTKFYIGLIKESGVIAYNYDWDTGDEIF